MSRPHEQAKRREQDLRADFGSLVSHGRRVGDLAGKLALEIGWTRADAERVRLAGTIHDIGKLLVPEEILSTPGRLSDAEFALVKLHPLLGYELFDGVPGVEDLRTALLHHHERIDGAGYPIGLAGPAIPPIARLLAVADAYDAMTSARVYRSSLSRYEALRQLADGAGTQFDASLVRAFVDIPPTSPEFVILPRLSEDAVALLRIARERLARASVRRAA